MEEVLDVYQQPADPDRPLVCMDEASKQLVGETRTPLPARPGDVAHEDYEYVRNGVANLFMFFAPLLGWRHVQVTDRRTRVDWAHAMRELVEMVFQLHGEDRFQSGSGALVQLFAALDQQRVVRHLLRQCMLEDVFNIARRYPARK